MSPFVVSRAAPHELLPACRLLFAATHADHSRDRLLADGRASALFVARDAGGRLHAAALVEALPGAMGVAWAPRGDSRDAIDAVTVAACAWLRERRVKVCQAFAAASERDEMAPLERCGFRHATQLVFLRREVDRERDQAVWQPLQSPLTLCSYKPGSAQPFAQTLVMTHEASLDCPELNEPRTTAELLDGFRQPEPTPARWYRVLATDVPHVSAAVGVLMFDDGPEPTDREISYVGIVPGARRRGYADQLIRFAIWVTYAQGDRALTVSVDARNEPAMKLYARHGFVEYDRREVWLASWSA